MQRSPLRGLLAPDVTLPMSLNFRCLSPDTHVACPLQDMSQFEAELKHLQVALEQAQATLTSPEAGRLSLKEQLSRRQVSRSTSGEMSGGLSFKRGERGKAISRRGQS